MTIIITDEDVARHLSMSDCIEAMGVAFKDFSKGDAVNLPRMRYAARHPDPERRYFANVHVGAVPSAGMAVVRAGSQIIKPVSPTNDRRIYENPRPFTWGFAILFDIATAEPLALMHEYHLSGMRVGATTGLAVKHMAASGAKTLGLFGSGKQASSAFDAIITVRGLERVFVYSPNASHQSDFVARKQKQTGGKPQVFAAQSPEQTVREADIVCCCTNGMNPVFDGNWLRDGQMVVTIANTDATTTKRSEVDETVFARASKIVVNDWESVVSNNQVELTGLIDSGVVSRENVVELGDVVDGIADVKAGGKGIVYYKSNSGLAIQFAAPGRIVYDRLKAAGGYKEIPTEWLGTDLSALYAAGFRPSP